MSDGDCTPLIPADANQVEFRDIVGNPGYRVGSNGVVMSCVEKGRPKGGGPRLSENWRPLGTRPFKNGYSCVTLSRGRKYYVHHLVLGAFRGPCPEGMECRHLDGNRTNNRLGNLAWGTSKENNADKSVHGTLVRGEMVVGSKLTGGCVRAILARVRAGDRHGAVARDFGVSHSVVSNIVRGVTWKHVSRH